ncbi:MAG: glutamate racemase [Eubacteriales bacterium]|nr:glutamate racemase [Eubacteriales bacterium]
MQEDGLNEKNDNIKQTGSTPEEPRHTLETGLDRNGRIAILDSGLGGISVLRELLKVMPEERYLYYGDSLNAPYGEKPAEWIRGTCRGHIERFLESGAKCVVLACNTATSAAAEVLRKEYPFLPIIGMEPAVKPAAEHGGSQRVLVLATPLTIRGDRLHHLVEEHGGSAEFILREAPGIVRFVEAGVCDAAPNEALYVYLRELLADFCMPPGDRSTDGWQKLDGVVLGCTHFPFVKRSIEKTLGYPVDVYDGAHGTAMQTRRRLEALSLLRQTKTQTDGEPLVLLQNSDRSMIPRMQMLLDL